MTPPAKRLSIALLATLTLAAPAYAQDATRWTGFHVGGHAGAVTDQDEANEGLLFDTNLDGQFGDVVRTGTGANAFSPGFCGEAAKGRTPQEGCDGDDSKSDFGVRVGYDMQIGTGVWGAVLEYARVDIRDSVTGFSTTPASYTMTRELDDLLALRIRGGFAFGADSRNLVYATAGAAKAKISNEFATTNGANTFTGNGDDAANGWQAGLGYERMIGDHFSVGAEYLHTKLNDDGYRVMVTRGNAPATNPFVLRNPNGTDMRRSNNHFEFGSLRITASYRF